VTRSTTAKLLAAAAIVASGAFGGSAFAAPPTPVVTVTHNDGGVQVGTGLPGQPLLGVSDDSRGVCVSFSYENGSCLPTTIK
jgi:hypothetical protein